jgi:hypothetical protein
MGCTFSYCNFPPHICDFVALVLQGLCLCVNPLRLSISLVTLFETLRNNFDDIGYFTVHVLLYRVADVVFELSAFFAGLRALLHLLGDENVPSVHEIFELVLDELSEL